MRHVHLARVRNGDAQPTGVCESSYLRNLRDSSGRAVVHVPCPLSHETERRGADYDGRRRASAQCHLLQLLHSAFRQLSDMCELVNEAGSGKGGKSCSA